MNERVKKVRKTLKISQEEFGNKLGVTKASISRIESGINNVTEQMAKSICHEYKVDYLWLTKGIGDMFIDIADTLLDQLVVQYELTLEETELLKDFLSLDKNERNVLMKFLRRS